MEPYAGTEASGAVLSVEWEPSGVEVRTQPQLQVQVKSRAEIQGSAAWMRAFAAQRKDRRYYELVEDTLRQGFDYRYFVLTGEGGEARAIQPFFLLDQDLLAGTGPRIAKSGGGDPPRVAALSAHANLDGGLCRRRRSSRCAGRGNTVRHRARPGRGDR